MPGKGRRSRLRLWRRTWPVRALALPRPDPPRSRRAQKGSRHYRECASSKRTSGSDEPRAAWPARQLMRTRAPPQDLFSHLQLPQTSCVSSSCHCSIGYDRPGRARPLNNLALETASTSLVEWATYSCRLFFLFLAKRLTINASSLVTSTERTTSAGRSPTPG